MRHMILALPACLVRLPILSVLWLACRSASAQSVEELTERSNLLAGRLRNVVIQVIRDEVPNVLSLDIWQETMRHSWFFRDDEETQELQLQVLDLFSQLWELFPSPGSIKDPRRRELVQQARAMVLAVQAAVPICRRNDVCIVDKTSMMLWRLADGGAHELLNLGMEMDLFRELHPYLPPSAKWQTPWQCPTILFPGIEGRPMWTVDELPEQSVARRVAVALREQVAALQSDLARIQSEDGMAHLKDPAWTGLSRGTWVAFVVYRAEGFHGRDTLHRHLDTLRCRIVPETCRILTSVGAPPGMTNVLPSLQGSQEVVDFLRADIGTTVSFHAASTNSRLTVQICLTGCDGENYIQAGHKKVHYRPGEPVIFDDSFLHSIRVHETSKEPRWALTVQVMHPQIESINGFVEYFSRYAPPPRGHDARDEPEAGGPVPAALESETESPWVESGSFHNNLEDTVLLYTALWGPMADGPETFLGEIASISVRPHDGGRGLQLPPLAHRLLLVAKNVTDGRRVKAWRVDASHGTLSRFVLP